LGSVGVRRRLRARQSVARAVVRCLVSLPRVREAVLAFSAKRGDPLRLVVRGGVAAETGNFCRGVGCPRVRSAVWPRGRVRRGGCASGGARWCCGRRGRSRGATRWHAGRGSG